MAEDLGVFGETLKFLVYPRKNTVITERWITLQTTSLLRFHVERVIGWMKNKYLTLKGLLPICPLKHKENISATIV